MIASKLRPYPFSSPPSAALSIRSNGIICVHWCPFAVGKESKLSALCRAHFHAVPQLRPAPLKKPCYLLSGLLERREVSERSLSSNGRSPGAWDGR
jgi:hypothetical protein